MKKEYLILLLILIFLWSCATYQVSPPALYIEDLPPSIVAELSLDERILTEDAWKNLKEGKASNAKKIISRLGAKSPFFNVSLGYACYLLNELETSEEYFEAALKDYPDIPLIHLGLAQIYQKTGKEDLAFNEFRKILKEQPEHPWALAEYEVIKDKKIKESIQEANSFIEEGDTENGKTAFLKALYYSPDSMEAHLSLSEIYKNENNLKNALIHLKAANEIEPQNKEILKKYGEALFLDEQLKKSLKVYEILEELEPENQENKKRLEIIKNRLGIFELPSEYDAISLSEAITKEQIAVLLAVKFEEFLDEPSGKPPIIIDISTSWASKFIIKTASLELLDVYPNHTFQPNKIVTRAEMAEILLRLINQLQKKGYKIIQQIPIEKIEISDVSPDNYYFRPVLLVISYNIMDLSLDKSFKPDLPISGNEAIRLLNIILSLIK